VSKAEQALLFAEEAADKLNQKQQDAEQLLTNVNIFSRQHTKFTVYVLHSRIYLYFLPESSKFIGFSYANRCLPPKQPKWMQ
jgi:hypothetical protein